MRVLVVQDWEEGELRPTSAIVYKVVDPKFSTATKERYRARWLAGNAGRRELGDPEMGWVEWLLKCRVIEEFEEGEVIETESR